MFDSKKKSVPSAEQKENEELIKKQKLVIAQLEGICSAFPDPYYVRDMDYNIIFWPDSVVKLTGYSEEEAKSLKCHEMFKACVCPPNSPCPTQGCVQNRQFLRDVAVDVFHKDGSTIHCLVSNAGVYDENGNPIGAVEVVKNNTKIKKGMDAIDQLVLNIDSMSTELSAIVDKMNVVSAKALDEARESTNCIKIGVENSAVVSEKSKQSSKYGQIVKSKMQAINDSMKLSVEKISTLREKSESITEFVKVIQDISFQTNLLAINASIEAAHAGEAGKGFMVVADAIRGLSKQSKESAELIDSTIETIIELILNTSSSLSVTEKDITSGTADITELLNFVSEIDAVSNKLADVIQLAEKAAAESSNLTGEEKQLTAEANKAGHDLEDISHSLAAEFQNVMNVIQHKDM